jgi:hypothetical protein
VNEYLTSAYRPTICSTATRPQCQERASSASASPYKSSALPRQDDLLVTTHSPSSAHIASRAFQAYIGLKFPAGIDGILRASRQLFLYSTPGIFFGSNTIRTNLNRATALDARRLVSEICSRVGSDSICTSSLASSISPYLQQPAPNLTGLPIAPSRASLSGPWVGYA